MCDSLPLFLSLSQPALLSAQISLSAEEEEEKHARHLWLPQEPQSDIVQSGARA